MFEQAVIEAVRLLAAAQSKGICVRFALIGGLAVSARGFPRATQDVDFLIDLPEKNCFNAASSLMARYLPPDLGDPLSGVFKLDSIKERTGIDVQVIRLGPKLTEIALEGTTTVEVCGIGVPVVSLKALIILKLYAGGPYDLLDVIKLLEVNNLSKDEMSSLEEGCTHVGLADSLRKVRQH